ncbi:MAG: MotA/TolQ/ExbB proton channel family protein [Candidatus Omnitrophica bacterium]|nr:MotA/TolQ/ExbB proton channel family protein [Candidatus Omnitrophota bacterium]
MNMSLFQLIVSGGFTMYILIGCSIISIAIMIDRVFLYMRLSRVNREKFMREIKDEIEEGNIKRAIKLCEEKNNHSANVVKAGLNLLGASDVIVENAMEREIIIENNRLERYTNIVGTIGSNSVYIGLFGTVLGIIKAFRNISLSGSGELNVIIGGISEALVCTAAGLLVAVPAVVAYNFFIKKIDKLTMEMELCVSEMMDIVKK